MPIREFDRSDATFRINQLLADSDEPPSVVVSHHRLMEVSEECLLEAQNSDVETEQRVATRILESTKDFRRWEAEHASLMRAVSGEHASASQRAVLLSGTLALIHRKALFEYISDHHIRGEARQRLIGHFFGATDYAHAVISEHGKYLRSAASYLCSTHVGTQLMLDAVFEAPLREYEALYQSYFQAYCDTVVMHVAIGAHTTPLLGLMKRQVCDWRNALLALAHSRSGTWRRPRL